MNKIYMAMGMPELLEQLAEEATELAQAALKLRRVVDGKNPTPVKYDDALENLLEEVADVDLVLAVLGLCESAEDEYARMDAKLARWKNRLNESNPDDLENKTESGLLEE